MLGANRSLVYVDLTRIMKQTAMWLVLRFSYGCEFNINWLYPPLSCCNRIWELTSLIYIFSFSCGTKAITLRNFVHKTYST